MRILLISATDREIGHTTDWLKTLNPVPPPVQGTEMGIPQTEQLTTGVGQLQTAYQLLKKIYTHRPEFIIQAGIGGSTETGDTGNVFCIGSERLGDLGAEERTGFQSIFELALADPDHFPFQNGSLINPYHRLLSWVGLPLREGLTINEISTSTARIQTLKQNTASFVESMEGAALHYICLLEKIPFLQIRSVSNVLGERDKRRWKLAEAVQNLNETLISLLKKLQSVDETIFRL